MWWRLALLGLCLSLSGCEFYAWRTVDFLPGQDPYMPVGSSENMLRAQGIPVVVQSRPPDPGDVWPPPIPP